MMLQDHKIVDGEEEENRKKGEGKMNGDKGLRLVRHDVCSRASLGKPLTKLHLWKQSRADERRGKHG